MTLSECVKLWLKSTGVKQNVVADRGGISQTNMSEIATGKNPDPMWSTVEKIAKGFGLSPAEFLSGPPRPEQDPGHAPRERNPLLAERWKPIVDALDADMQAEDTWRGDTLKAIAVLTRALSRTGS